MSYLAYFDEQNMVLYVRFPFMPNGDKVVSDFKSLIPPAQRSYNEPLGRSWSFAFRQRGIAMNILWRHGYRSAVVSNGSGKPDGLWCQSRPDGSDGPGSIEGHGAKFSWWRTSTGGDQQDFGKGPDEKEFPEQDDIGRFRWENDPARPQTYRRKVRPSGVFGAWEFIDAHEWRSGAGAKTGNGGKRRSPFEDANGPQDFDNLFETLFGPGKKRKQGSGGGNWWEKDESDYRGSYGSYGSSSSGRTQAPPRRAVARTSHEILFVTADAPKEVIAAAYKALARKYHPDAGGSDSMMKELNAAYDKIKG